MAVTTMDALDRFPHQNPNPVMRVSRAGHLVYANAASEPIRLALGLEVGDALPADLLADLWRQALDDGAAVEVTHEHRTYTLLPVYVADLDFLNVYGTDVTGEKVVARFPDQNPNPVFRVDYEGRLLYANLASQPVVEAHAMEVGRDLPADIRTRLLAAADLEPPPTIDIRADHRTFAFRPVRIPEFDFINVYGTDITAEKAIDRFPGGNPNPVLRVSREGELLYSNDASAHIVAALGLGIGGPIPADLFGAIGDRLAGRASEAIEVPADDRVYEIKPVIIPEFGFINLYGTDVTAVRQLAAAHRENERLLLNILPPPIAARLLRGEKVIADRFDEVTLLFADIVDFTVMSSRLEARQVVELLNEIFNISDRLADDFGLEKIKTIGDAYMVVGGLPETVADHAERIADMALALSDELLTLPNIAGEPLRCRMGIHLGPAVAGVIGSKKFIYDVWGDTVNTASRMESHGVPGRVQVTAPVFRRLEGAFAFERRGVIEVKGKGPMETWFLLGRR